MEPPAADLLLTFNLDWTWRGSGSPSGGMPARRPVNIQHNCPAVTSFSASRYLPLNWSPIHLTTDNVCRRKHFWRMSFLISCHKCIAKSGHWQYNKSNLVVFKPLNNFYSSRIFQILFFYKWRWEDERHHFCSFQFMVKAEVFNKPKEQKVDEFYRPVCADHRSMTANHGAVGGVNKWELQSNIWPLGGRLLHCRPISPNFVSPSFFTFQWQQPNSIFFHKVFQLNTHFKKYLILAASY